MVSSVDLNGRRSARARGFQNRRTEWNVHHGNYLGQQSEDCKNWPNIWVQTTRSHHHFSPCKTEPYTYGLFREACGDFYSCRLRLGSQKIRDKQGFLPFISFTSS